MNHLAEINFEKNILTINVDKQKKIIKFKYPINKIQKFDNCLVVIIEPPLKTVFNENVFGVSYEGKLLWQIENINHMNIDSPYTGISEKDGLLIAYNWDGFDYTIDPKNGRIIDKKFVK